MVEHQGSDPSLIQKATLTLHYDIGTERPTEVAPRLKESPYVCDVRITDIRGKEYTAQFTGWWFPETLIQPELRTSWWAKIWKRIK